MKAIDLEQNLEYIEAQRKKEKEFQEKEERVRKIETPILNDFHKKKLTDVNSLSELLRQEKINLPLTNAILRWISLINNEDNVQEILIRALARAEKSFEGTELIRLFDDPESSQNLKWVIGNTIASAKVLNINKWLENKFNINTHCTENEMLIYAAPKYLGINESKRIIKMLFPLYPLQVGDVLSRIGNETDLEFLKLESEQYKNEMKQQLKRFISKLEKKAN